MRKTSPLIVASLAAALSLAAAPAMAQSKGDWTVSAGVHQVAPKSNNGWLAGGPEGRRRQRHQADHHRRVLHR